MMTNVTCYLTDSPKWFKRNFAKYRCNC